MVDINKYFNYSSILQKKIIEDSSRITLINGCAGSRKTDTLIKKGIYQLLNYKRNILFITFVSSVTNEIKKRIEDMLSIVIKRVGNSNHYISSYKDNFIEISNIDAWIHKQLEYLLKNIININDILNIKDITENSNNFKKKVITLLNISQQYKFFNIVLKNDSFADLLIVDEFQDTDISKVKLINIFITNNPDLYCTVAGDLLQTIFIENIMEKSFTNSITYFKNFFELAYFEITTCYRCPAPHIEFVNYLLEEYYEKYAIKKIESYNKNYLHKPVLFMHEPISKNSNAYTTAYSVSESIIEILMNDNEIKPSDIVVIMKKSNNNTIFEQIKIILNSFYKTINMPENSVINFETCGDGFTNTINWDKAINKTVLLSVHGDKGKGHKVVFFLGLSKKSIPNEYYVNSDYELLDISLLNVALTRSEKYLFIGFTENYPSPYLTNKYEHLSSYCYLAWDKKTYSSIHPYNNIIKKLNNYWFNKLPYSRKIPKFKNSSKQISFFQLAPIKNNIRIVEDISKDLIHFLDTIITKYTIDIENTYNIQNTDKIDTNYDISFYQILGYCGEMLIFRKKFIELHLNNKIFNNLFYEILISILNVEIYYTTSELLLNIVTDIHLNNEINNFEKWNYKILDIELNNNNLIILNELENIKKIKNPVFIISTEFKTCNIKKIIQLFVSNINNIEFISFPSNLLLITLLYIEMNTDVRKADMFYKINEYCINNSTQKIFTKIVHNVDFFYDKYLKNNEIEFQKVLNIETKITDKNKLHEYGFDYNINRDIFKNGYKLSIKGKTDLYNITTNSLFEIKTCIKTSFSKEWLLQIFMYYLLMKEIYNITCNKIFIINIYDGCVYKITLIEFQKLNNILKLYNFNDYAIKKLCISL
jgi:hypothetical protein